MVLAIIKAHFKGIVKGEVIRYGLPTVQAVNFVMHQALFGGVTRSLSLDPHGKSYSALILRMTVELPEDIADELETIGRKPLS